MGSSFEAYDPTVQRPYIREQYPRLRSEESVVLRQYLSEIDRDSIDRLRTAVPVGEGEIPGKPETQKERATKSLTQLKIDAVIDYPSRQEIIEIKSRATHTAAGQLLVYDLLLGQRPDEPVDSRLIAAAFRAQPDFRRISRKLPVQLHLVPDADPSSATERFLEDMQEFRRG